MNSTLSPENPFVLDVWRFRGFPVSSLRLTANIKSLTSANVYIAGMLGTLLNSLLLHLIFSRTPISVRRYSQILLFSVITDLTYGAMDMFCEMRFTIADGVFLLNMGGLAGRLPYVLQIFSVQLYIAVIVFAASILPIQFYCRYRLTVVNDFNWNPIGGLIAVVLTMAVGQSLVGTYVYRYSGEIRPGFDYGSLWTSEVPIPQIIVANSESPMEKALASYMLAVFLASYIAIGILLYRMFHNFRSNRPVGGSQRTRLLQSQYTRVMIIQAVIPVLSCGVPTVLSFISMLFHGKMDYVGAGITIALAWTPTLNPMTSILLIAPYRRFVFHLFRRKLHEESHTAESRWQLLNMLPHSKR